MIISYMLVMRRTWGNFEALLDSIPDHRKRHSYQVAEIVMGGLAMHLFLRGSRNNADKMVRGRFEQNYLTVFGLRLPIMETVEEFLRNLPPEEIEILKKKLVSTLIRCKRLDKWRFNGKFTVMIDGSGMMSFDHEPFPGCPFRTSSTGKMTWTAYVVEAMLCCGNGFCISLASEWLDSSENMDDKQDCEQKAFARLAQKLKKDYPRLPIIIVADALYPNNTSLNICRENGWNYIFVFKDGSLPSVWEEVNTLMSIGSNKSNRQERINNKNGKWIEETSMFLTDIVYNKHSLNWIECTSKEDGKQQRFVHITDIKTTQDNVWEISRQGRMRWKIENEGFNTLKNSGLNMQHKYARKHLWSMKNFYQLLLIGHMLIQLNQKLKTTATMIAESGITLMAAMEDMLATMVKQVIEKELLDELIQNTGQLRY